MPPSDTIDLTLSPEVAARKSKPAVFRCVDGVLEILDSESEEHTDDDKKLSAVSRESRKGSLEPTVKRTNTEMTNPSDPKRARRGSDGNLHPNNESWDDRCAKEATNQFARDKQRKRSGNFGSHSSARVRRMQPPPPNGNSIIGRDDDDDVCLLVPSAVQRVKPASPPSGDSTTGGDDDVCLMGSIGQNAITDFPHSRENCVLMPLAQGDPRRHCGNCFAMCVIRR
jgi:hypothetical protein